MKISLNWLRDFIKIAPPYEKLAEDLTMAGLTVEGVEEMTGEPKDVVFDVEITTNRPDWLSHWGVAREAAAVRNLSLKAPDIYTKIRADLPPGWTLDLRDAEGCPYYSGVLLEGIPNKIETPAWIKNRLGVCGLRSVNFVVDITNYVLLETGQPLHAFDAALLKDSKIKVRRAKAGEKLVLIDSKEVILQANDLVIADANHPVALAGIMGGKSTEVTLQTQSVFLESAYFSASVIRQAAQRHALKSDSSYRFERRVDPAGVDFARNRAIHLILEYAKPHKISVSGVIRAGQLPEPSKKSIKLSLERIQQVLGITVKASEVISILTRLGLSVSAPSSKSLLIKVPSYRCDLLTDTDLIEEVARIHGYGNIPETLPERAPVLVQDHPQFKLETFLRPRLAGLGFHETVTFSLTSAKGIEPDELKKAVELVNPQNQEMRWMRPTLLPSLLTVLRKNLDMRSPQTFLFEIANVYRQAPRENRAQEDRVLALLMCGQMRPAGWAEAGRVAGYHDLKASIQAVLQGLGISGMTFEPAMSETFECGILEVLKQGASMVGRLGQVRASLCAEWGIDEPVFFAEIKFESLVQNWVRIRPLAELPRFPSVVRDLSIVVPEAVKAGEISTLIAGLGQELVKDVRVFDVFRGGRVPANFKNLGISITYQSAQKTLVADDVQELHARIAGHIAKQYQATFQ
ncbi:MAG: phenylalanine--tRNA ligase subunit beta [Candidatus Omnitrophica bacterium]|nr:phenylalanine--tRNA ligase subunit beta [Candidatus Omnitrophota bacterium]